MLLLDGVFLCRPELGSAWDLRIFVSVEPAETLRRALIRDAELLGSRDDVDGLYRERYLAGQRLYLTECKPLAGADAVVLNDEPDRPVLRERPTR